MYLERPPNTEVIGQQKKNGDHSNHIIVKNTRKSPGDLRKLSITQFLLKDQQLTLVWKICEEWKNYIFTLREFFTSSLIGVFFHWSQCDSKSPEVSSTFLSILVDLNSSGVWMVLIFFFDFPILNSWYSVYCQYLFWHFLSRWYYFVLLLKETQILSWGFLLFVMSLSFCVQFPSFVTWSSRTVVFLPIFVFYILDRCFLVCRYYYYYYYYN